MKFVGGQLFFFLRESFDKIAAQVRLFDAFYTDVVVVGVQIIGGSSLAAVVGFVSIQTADARAQVVGFVGQSETDEDSPPVLGFIGQEAGIGYPQIAAFFAIEGEDNG